MLYTHIDREKETSIETLCFTISETGVMSGGIQRRALSCYQNEEMKIYNIYGIGSSNWESKPTSVSDPVCLKRGVKAIVLTKMILFYIS